MLWKPPQIDSLLDFSFVPPGANIKYLEKNFEVENMLGAICCQLFTRIYKWIEMPQNETKKNVESVKPQYIKSALYGFND